MMPSPFATLTPSGWESSPSKVHVNPGAVAYFHAAPASLLPARTIICFLSRVEISVAEDCETVGRSFAKARYDATWGAEANEPEPD